jgi:hypothetical protein
MRDFSVNIAKFFRTKSVDMVFIDGGHTTNNVISDILNWLPICNKLLCGHDINMEGVEAAIVGINLDVELVPYTVIWVHEIKG